MSFKHLTITRDGHVAVVEFNRPEKLNALSIELMEEIEQAANSFSGDGETRVVIFTGKGKHFTAGADLTDAKRTQVQAQPLVSRRHEYRLGARMIRALYEMDQITIAAINGGALGGGACIVTALDFRIGAEGCFVSYPEIHLGMNLSWGGLPLCVHLVGPSRAKRMVILGEKEQADTLLDWGFLNEVVPAEKLMVRAKEIAGEYASRPPVPAQMIKRSVNMISSALDQAVMHMDADQFLFATSTEDHEEGVRAFFEKRKPEYKGK